MSVDSSDGPTRVTAFHTIEYSPGDLDELCAELTRVVKTRAFPSRAHVVLWNARAVHLVLDPPGGRADVEAYAREAALRRSGEFRGWADEAWMGIAAGDEDESPLHRVNRQILFAAMSAADVRVQLRPLFKAGFVIESVASPALALTGIARLRRWEVGDTVTAYLAMNREAAALSVLHGQRLLLTRNLAWEYRSEHPSVQGRLIERYDFASRVAHDVREAFDEVRTRFGIGVDHIITCGDLTSLRSLTMPLIEQLDVEVEALDSIVGFDLSALPQPQNLFLDQIARLRLAWAMAASLPLVGLQPPARPESIDRRGLRVAVGGLAAVAGVVLIGSVWPQVRPAPYDDPVARLAAEQSRHAPATATSGENRSVRGPVGSTPEPRNSDDQGGAGRNLADGGPDGGDVELRAETAWRREDDQVVPFAGAVRRPSAIARALPGDIELKAPSARTDGLSVASAAQTREMADLLSENAAPTISAAPVARTAKASGAAAAHPAQQSRARSRVAPGTSVVAAAGLPVRAAVSPAAPKGQARRAANERPDEPIRPDPIVRSILFSLDRRLAVVDDRIVGVGDSIGGGEVIDITRNVVVLRLPSGNTTRLDMKTPLGAGTRR